MFLDNFPAFNFNSGAGEYTQTKQKTDTRRLGSTLLKTMLQEVADFCDPTIKENWTKKPHQQVHDPYYVYLSHVRNFFVGGGGGGGVVTIHICTQHN